MTTPNHPTTQQATSHEAVVGSSLPEAPAPPVEVQPPVPHVIQAPTPQNVSPHNHQVAHVAAEPVAIGTLLTVPGTSPLHRSLYGLSLGN
ncbi:unnamed protein product [Rhizoctonia solani]|uniref:Uncharacterized protein n=1 Tax=Rhizoctonia solani TaxID=456999 RepID=A0A8H3DVU0_9AGAM|nr:unnamed protein product [Rhizoctonia solani]